MGPAELGKFTRSELTYWSDIIRKLNIRAE
jgi:hypothetical protein